MEKQASSGFLYSFFLATCMGFFPESVTSSFECIFIQATNV